MDWFKCQHCGHVCNEHTADSHEESERSEFWGAVALTVTTFHVCPGCGSDDLRDYHPCVTCVDNGSDEPNEPLHGTDHCASCMQAECPEDFAEYLQQWPADVPAEFRRQTA